MAKIKSSKKVIVKFIKSYTPYVKGDVAGFSKKKANLFIENGIAKENKGDK